MDKKTIGIIVAVLVVVVLVVLGVIFLPSNNEKGSIDGNLEDIIGKLYEGIPEDTLPSSLTTFPITENIEYYLGTSDIDYSEAVVSEPMMSSIAHSVVLVRLNEGANVEETMQKIKDNVNPRKWVCVWVEDENVRVLNRGNVILLIMTNTSPDIIENNV